ncbi:MAG: hypothetical protein ABSF81_16090 [Bacteroidales bacterium]
MPSRTGVFKYSTYHKFDIIIKNETGKPIYNQVINVVFNKGVIIHNIVVADQEVLITSSDNSAIINICRSEVKQTHNIDLYIENLDLACEAKLIAIAPINKITRSKKIPVKKILVNNKVEWNNNKIKAFFYNPWIVKIGGAVVGGLILYFIIAHLSNNSQKTNPNNAIIPDTSQSNTHYKIKQGQDSTVIPSIKDKQKTEFQVIDKK